MAIAMRCRNLSGQSCHDDSWVRMGYMVRNKQSGFLQTFQVFEARHFDAAQKPRQGKDETLEESPRESISSLELSGQLG